MLFGHDFLNVKKIVCVLNVFCFRYCLELKLATSITVIMWYISNYLDAVVKYMLFCLHFFKYWKFMFVVFCFQNDVHQGRAYVLSFHPNLQFCTRLVYLLCLCYFCKFLLVPDNRYFLEGV
jgi:hypothetical protein